MKTGLSLSSSQSLRLLVSLCILIDYVYGKSSREFSKILEENGTLELLQLTLECHTHSILYSTRNTSFHY